MRTHVYERDIPALSPTVRVMARRVSEITFTVKRNASNFTRSAFPALSHLKPVTAVSVQYRISSASNNEALNQSAIALIIAVRRIII
jgi:hypothetical protein